MNKLVVFTGPSAVGKATIEKRLFNDESLKLRFSISATTRSPRPGEEDGVHYHFMSHEEFDQKIKDDEFIEWNEHFSNKYGTLKSEIDRISSEGYKPFIEVEVIGAKNIIEQYGDENIVSIFIAPPTLEDLRKRMLERGTETQEQVEGRLDRVRHEMEFTHLFQHVVVNDSIDHAVQQVKDILKGK